MRLRTIYGSRINNFMQRPVLMPIRDQKATPLRTSSNDGTCVLDVVLENNGATYDHATFAEIGKAAAQLVDTCAGPDPFHHRQSGPVGGFIGKVGLQGNLVIILRQYYPRVVCGKQWKGFGDCKPVMDKMQANNFRDSFGLPGEKGVNVITPAFFKGGDTTCAVRVDVVKPRRQAYSVWFDVWAAAEAINAMCVSYEKEGFAYNIGKRNIHLAVLFHRDVDSATSR
ncbi:MAG: hypothetical protein Q9220_007010 [cf. Caloplaca sp. 1 TL-2023]